MNNIDDIDVEKIIKDYKEQKDNYKPIEITFIKCSSCKK